MSCPYFPTTPTSTKHAAKPKNCCAPRELGLPSWPALVREIDARTTSIPEDVIRFLRFSVNLQIGAAARMLHENPSLAQSGFPAAVVFGDAARVEAELRHNPGAA